MLNIPEKIRVGYRERSDTYSGKLGYVIYYRGKKLAKEQSWNNWVDKTLGYNDYDNVPTEGFVLNRSAGGYATGWNHRRTYIRVYDPRGFEIEISTENLLFILENCDCLKGKGLEGKFIYSWDGKDLVLLPCNSVDYQDNMKRIKKTVAANLTPGSLVIGKTYKVKDYDNMLDLVYLGRCIYRPYTVKDDWQRDYNGRRSGGMLWKKEKLNNYLFYYKTKEKYYTPHEYEENVGIFKSLRTLNNKLLFCEDEVEQLDNVEVKDLVDRFMKEGKHLTLASKVVAINIYPSKYISKDFIRSILYNPDNYELDIEGFLCYNNSDCISVSLGESARKQIGQYFVNVIGERASRYSEIFPYPYSELRHQWNVLYKDDARICLLAYYKESNTIIRHIAGLFKITIDGKNARSYLKSKGWQRSYISNREDENIKKMSSEIRENIKGKLKVERIGWFTHGSKYELDSNKETILESYKDEDWTELKNIDLDKIFFTFDGTRDFEFTCEDGTKFIDELPYSSEDKSGNLKIKL